MKVLITGGNGYIATSLFKKLNKIKNWLSQNPKVGALIAPNFGLGAVLMMQFAAQASKYFESVEIVELHHPNKADAPSGTATRTAEMITEARKSVSKEKMPDATTSALPDATISSACFASVIKPTAIVLMAASRFTVSANGNAR